MVWRTVCSSLARSSYSQVLYRHSELMRLRRMQCRMRSHCFRSFREWQLRWRSHRLFLRCVGAGDRTGRILVIKINGYYVSMTAMVLFIFSLLLVILKAYKSIGSLQSKNDGRYHISRNRCDHLADCVHLLATFRAAGDAKACMYI